MEAAARYYRQTLDLFRSLTPGGRLLAALLCGVITVSLAWLVRYQSVESYEYLLGGQHFARREIEAIEVAFASQGLRGSEVVGQQIRIPRGRKQEFLSALAKGDALPERFNPDEMLLEGGLLDPRDVRDQRQRIAGQNKLAMLIEKMPGIENASVQIDEVRISSFPTRVEKRAIALVSASGRRPLRDNEIRAIRDTLVGYIAGISAEHVTVTDLEAMQAYPGGEMTRASDGASNTYANSKRTFEVMWREKISERLVNYPGVVVAVNVDLHEPVPPRIAPDPADVSDAHSGVGNLPQAVGEPRDVASSTPKKPLAIAGDRQPATDASAILTPRRVTASIDVPRSHYGRVWHESWQRANPAVPRNVSPHPPSAEALEQIERETKLTIERAVAHLLPPLVADSAISQPQVLVTSYEDLPLDVVAMASQYSLTSWLAAHWQTIGMFTLAIVSLWMVRRFVRGASPARAPRDRTAPREGYSELIGDDAEIPEYVEEREVTAEWSTQTPARDSSSELRNQLRDLVNTDPDAAAEALRNWIGDAA